LGEEWIGKRAPELNGIMARKSMTGSKLRSKTPIFSRFNRGNLVPVTDFHTALLFPDRN
jgi:hypothetical protein